MLEELGTVENLHDERNGDNISHVRGAGGARIARGGWRQCGPRHRRRSLDGERARLLVGGNDGPLSRLLVLAPNVVTGECVKQAGGR